jgi:hypothetical protein
MDIDPTGATIYHFPVASITKSSSATEEAGAVPVVPAGTAASEVKESSRPFLAAARRNLTEEEACSPAGIRWLTHDVERLDRECSELHRDVKELRQRHDGLKDQYTERLVELEAAKKEGRGALRNEILSGICLCAGSAGFAIVPELSRMPEAGGIPSVIMAASAVMLIGAIALRVWK